MLSTRREGYLQCRLSCSMARTVTSCWQRGSGGVGVSQPQRQQAAISPASGSRPTTAEPPAPSPAPAQQGPEAVLSSLPHFVRAAIKNASSCWSLRALPHWHCPQNHPKGRQLMPASFVQRGQLLREITLKHGERRFPCVRSCVQQSPKSPTLLATAGQRSAF